jgi:hypothetical protein
MGSASATNGSMSGAWRWHDGAMISKVAVEGHTSTTVPGGLAVRRGRPALALSFSGNTVDGRG